MGKQKINAIIGKNNVMVVSSIQKKVEKMVLTW